MCSVRGLLSSVVRLAADFCSKNDRSLRMREKRGRVGNEQTGAHEDGRQKSSNNGREHEQRAKTGWARADESEERVIPVKDERSCEVGV